MAQTHQNISSPAVSVETFQAGQSAPYSGEYALVDAQGNRQGFDLVTLDEGDSFPPVPEQNLFYTLNDTCLDEECDVEEHGHSTQPPHPGA